MTVMPPDPDLVSAFTLEGSDSAFHALVNRHIDLVFATALRQVGDPGIAEEIAQNVFTALARKAPRLGGLQTLAGWLHRTTLLEAKARIRSELRRRRREETAAALVHLDHEGASALRPLVPLLDEGLLTLSEPDRMALVLRFLEDRSLRDVGAILGIDEDAARKRVSRALAKLTGFFRRHGFSVGGEAQSADLFSLAVKAAPLGLAASSANAAVASGPSATAATILLFKLMALSKTETALICTLMAAAPIVWEWRAEARVNTRHTQAAAELAATEADLGQVESKIRRTRQAIVPLQTEILNADLRRETVEAQRNGRRPVPAYRWDDNSPVARVPKAFLAGVQLSAVSDKRFKLRPEMQELLQMTDEEAAASQGALHRFLNSYYAAQELKMRLVPATEKDLLGHTPGQTRVFAFSDLTTEVRDLRQTLFSELEATLGRDRFELFRRALDGWMPVDDRHHGLNTGMAVFDFEHRVRFYEPKPGQSWLDWSLGKTNGEMMSATVMIDDLPAFLRPHLQDWMSKALSQLPSQVSP